MSVYLINKNVFYYAHTGQFYHGVQFEVRDMRPGEEPEKPDATMLVKGQELTVTRYCDVFTHTYTYTYLIIVSPPCFFSAGAGRGTSAGM
jgi:hypothetical protein